MTNATPTLSLSMTATAPTPRSSFVDYSDTFDAVTWEEMEAAMSEAESAPPLTPSEQLDMLFPLPLPPIAPADSNSTIQSPLANWTGTTVVTQSSATMHIVKDEPELNSLNSPITPASNSYADAQLYDADVLLVIPQHLYRVPPSRLMSRVTNTASVTTRPVSNTLYNASDVLPMPGDDVPPILHPSTTNASSRVVAARLSRTVSAPDARPSAARMSTKPKRAHSHTYSPVTTHSAVVARPEKRRRRTESRDLHPAGTPSHRPAMLARMPPRPFVVPSNAHSHATLSPASSSPAMSLSGPESPSESYSMPTPPASPAVTLVASGPASITAPVLRAPSRRIVSQTQTTAYVSEEPERRGQMVWPGIYFST